MTCFSFSKRKITPKYLYNRFWYPVFNVPFLRLISFKIKGDLIMKNSFLIYLLTNSHGSHLHNRCKWMMRELLNIDFVFNFRIICRKLRRKSVCLFRTGAVRNWRISVQNYEVKSSVHQGMITPERLQLCTVIWNCVNLELV